MSLRSYATHQSDEGSSFIALTPLPLLVAAALAAGEEGRGAPGATLVLAQSEVTSEELAVERKVKSAVSGGGQVGVGGAG